MDLVMDSGMMAAGLERTHRMTVPFADHVVRKAGGPRWSTIDVGRRLDQRCNDVAFAIEEGDVLYAGIVDAASADFGADTATPLVLRNLSPTELTPHGVSEALFTADMSMAMAGIEHEVSAVALLFRGDRVMGSSAGDCEAWYLPLDGGNPLQMTIDQNRRPRIGATAAPIEFDLRVPARGLVVAGSDGFWVNVSRAEVFGLARDLSRDGGTAHLAFDLAHHVYRRKNGVLPEDISVFATSVG